MNLNFHKFKFESFMHDCVHIIRLLRLILAQIGMQMRLKLNPAALCIIFIYFLNVFAYWNSWQVISPVEVAGYIVVVDELLAVQNKTYGRPTILLARSVKGEEEIPDGTVAVLTPDMPDVLSHVSVRARNCKVTI